MTPVFTLIGQDEALTGDNEAALIHTARTDQAAFGQLYQRYLPRIYRYLRVRTSSPDEAADLTQQVFLRALEAFPSYRERGAPFAALLFRIAHNLAVDAYRRQRHLAGWNILPDTLTSLGMNDSEATLLRQEALMQLHALLAGLDDNKRELLALRFAGGLSSREIAAVVGKSEAAVKRQLTRNLRRLEETVSGRVYPGSPIKSCRSSTGER
jgi:RNA polymerase sigma-70 factor (ECF subfamily)